MKKLNEREKKRRKFLKIYKSVENKLHGENLIWWNSLTREARYHFVFRWCTFLYFRKKTVKSNIINAPEREYKFKYFLKDNKKLYNPTIANARISILDYLLNEEK